MPRPYVVPMAAVLAAACSSTDVEPGSCPEQSVLRDGMCHRICVDRSVCRVDQACVEGVCAAPVAGPPEVVRFIVEPAVVVRGEPVQVTYAVLNARHVRLTLNDPSGSTRFFTSDSRFANITPSPDVDVEGPVTIGIEVIGDGGHATDVRPVLVVDEPRELTIASFTASPTVVLPGRRTTLSWQVINGEGTVRIINRETAETVLSNGSLDGAFEVPVAETTTFTLLANGPDGQTDDADVEVVVQNNITPGIQQFISSAGPIDVGDAALLSWRTLETERIRLHRGTVDGPVLYDSRDEAYVNEGHFVVLPTQDRQSYTLEAFTVDGVKQASLDVRVNAAPVAAQISNFFADPPIFPFESGDLASVEFAWNVSPPMAQPTLTIDGRRINGTSDGGYVEFLPTEDTLIVELQVDAPGGMARRRLRVWDRRNETEPNDDYRMGNASDGHAMLGVLAPGVANQDWSTFVGIDEGSVRLSFLDNTQCPSTLELELWQGATKLVGRRATGGVCPTIVRRKLDPELYHVVLKQPDNGVSFDYLLGIAVDPPLCGDGLIASGEACDDGNLRRNDACTPSCAVDPAYDYRVLDSDISRVWTPAPPSAQALRWLPYVEGQPAAATDEGFAVVPLPFPFQLYGRRYHGVVVHSNGYLSLQGDLSAPDINPRAAWGDTRPNALVAPVHADLVWGEDSAVRVWTSEITGLGQIVWFDFSEGRGRGETTRSAEARVGLSSENLVVFEYGEMETNRTFNAGIEDHTGQYRYSLCDAPACTSGRAPSNTVTVLGNTVR